MSSHIFRNPDKVPLLPYREWARKNLPDARNGMVIEDIDMTVRTWGTKYNENAFGKIRFIEIKHQDAWPSAGQMLNMKGIDEILRKGDPLREVYLGFYIVQHDDADWQGDLFYINRTVKLTKDEFVSFLNMENGTDNDIKPYDFRRFKMQTGIKLTPSAP